MLTELYNPTISATTSVSIIRDTFSMTLQKLSLRNRPDIREPSIECANIRMLKSPPQSAGKAVVK
jgi:hypothetical protein